jgi:6-phosphogluconate dehydrogenase
MQLGVVGLGRMGTGLVRRLLDRGHTIVAQDIARERVEEIANAGAAGARTLDDLVGRLARPRAVWIMVPHGDPTAQTIESLLPRLDVGDILIDGGNSRYTDSMRHAGRCHEQRVHFLDVGVSGGVWGAEQGFNLMIGGSGEAVARMQPIFEALAPQGGYAHVGPSGAGHFVKMVHNAIEYAMLQAIGEGFECLHRSEFDLDLRQVAELWLRGAVVRSWLLELLGRALKEEGNALDGVGSRVDDSGTGRWAVEYAVAHGIPVPSFSVALYERFDSRMPKRFAHQVIAALRNQFGGHAVHDA